MKLKFIHTIYILFAVLTSVLMWACEDDFNPDMGGIVDGTMTTVPISISFDPETSADLSSRALGPEKGDAIQDINSFWMVLYKSDGTFYKKFHIRENGNDVYEHPGEVDNIKYDGDNDNRLPGEGNLGDDATGRLKFDLNIPSDKYYIYGVANVKDFGSKDITTRNRLKNIECRWDSTSITNNSEMFGIFSIGQNRGATDASPITVTAKREKAQQLHCWLRRLASKVTVAFDGSELYNNVEVYIDTIMIRDVPKKCLLGMPNHPGQDPNDLENLLPSDQRYNVDNGVYRFGGIDEIQKLTDADLKALSPISYYHVCNSSHIYGGDGSTPGDNPEINLHKHSHTAEKSLYFYENLQGEGKDKTQTLDGTTIWKPNPEENDLESGWKDGKAYGTYVEVRGYYRCTAPDGSISSGWIKYRFMLGQDAKTDYNALRNTHYKLTLKLRGYGNDYDWHIDYKEDSGIFITSPQFISYLYNKSMYATVKIVGEIEEGSTLEAQILDNSDKNFTDWGPWGNGTEEYPDPNKKTVTGPGGESLVMFMKNNLAANTTGAHTSFLSLRKTNTLKIEVPGYEGLPSYAVTTAGALNYLKSYSIPKLSRKYKINSADIDAAEEVDGRYTIQETKYGEAQGGSKKGTEVPVERLFRIPLFTRAKELVTRTGFVGNNPYIAYPRKMTVRFTAKIWDKDAKAYVAKNFDLDIIQVRRIINPKGVWRSGDGKPEDFHVQLLRLPEDDATIFKQFTSIGKWSAEVVSQSDPIISLTSTPEGSGIASGQSNVRRIEGDDEKPIDFWINFNGAKGFAVVRVRYHNYTCEHDIFCQVGKDPVQLNPNVETWWMPTNVLRFESDGKAVYANSPLQEGSLFRRASLNAISSSNSTVNTIQSNTSAETNFSVYKPGSSTKSQVTWNNCRATEADSTARFAKWEVANPNTRIADCFKDFYSITSIDGNINDPIKKAYGILYGDGATSPVTQLTDAYGYDDENGGPSKKGMRGVFVYNSNTARQVFFPLGISGHGRRKCGYGWTPSNYTKDPPGTMRYASRPAASPDLTSQPLFYDLYRRPGAIYWCENYMSTLPKKNGYSDVRYSSSFDMNFFSMGFEGFENGAIVIIEKQKKNAKGQLLYTDNITKTETTNSKDSKGNANVKIMIVDRHESDACFIRTVRTTPPQLSNWFSAIYRHFSDVFAYFANVRKMLRAVSGARYDLSILNSERL